MRGGSSWDDPSHYDPEHGWIHQPLVGGVMKSHEKDHLIACECILLDASAKCSTGNVSISRDLETLDHRLTYEGLSFLTITLPNFGKDFEKSLAEGRITSSAFHGWKRRMCLPAFLQGFTRLVFSAETGGLLDNPDTAAIEGIRQIAYTFKKLQIPCTPERESMALSGFKEVECFLSRTMFSGDCNLFNKVSNLLWSNVLDEPYDGFKFTPKHGPGQTAERISGNRKYSQRTWYERLEPFFPSDIYLMSCYSQLDDKIDGIECVQYPALEEELPVRVVTVPKTLKGPRIIAIEPVCMQYAQQALSSYIVKKIESSKLTGGHLNFTDQSINQRLAMSASSDESYATLDLSDASDRVPLSLVMTMLDSIPDFRDAILACRSKAAQLPSGEVIHLKKFASMGSALCFPIESMYFFTVILCALFEKHKLPVTLRNIYKLSRKVYVYGDDIIIATDEVEVVTETLTSFYCRVNATKSFWTGKFRESCGMDAYDGYNVTPTYIRRLRPCDKSQVSELLSWIASSNLFYLKGYWKIASYMKDIVEQILGELPIVQETSPGIGWLTYQRGFSFHRWSKKLHRFEIKTYVASPVYKKDPLGGWSALLKFFLNAENRKYDDPVDSEHLSRSSRSGTSSIKRRWTTPY